MGHGRKHSNAESVTPKMPILERLERDMTKDAYYGIFRSLVDGSEVVVRLTEREANAYREKRKVGERHQEPRRDGYNFIMMVGGPLYTNGQTFQDLRPGQIAPTGGTVNKVRVEGGFKVVVPDPNDNSKELTWFDLKPEWVTQDAQRRVTLVADDGEMINRRGNKEYTFTLVDNQLTLVRERDI